MPVLEKVQRGVPFTIELHGGRNSVVNGTPRSSIQFLLNTLFSDFLVGESGERTPYQGMFLKLTSF